MLRRNLRDSYQAFSMSDEQKSAMLTDIMENRPKDAEIKGKTWKPRGQAGSWVLIILALLVLTGAGLYASYSYGFFDYVSLRYNELKLQWEQKNPAVESTEPIQTLPENTTEPEPIPEPYEAIVAKYVQGINEEWDIIRCEEEKISYMIVFLDDPAQLGYCHMDLDGDGLRELVITDGNVIYDLYSYNEDGAIWVLSGGERNSYSLTNKNVLLNVGSNGAASTVYTLYRYSAGNLIVDQQIVFDANRDEVNPWFRGFGDLTTAQPITEEEANAIFEAYPKAPISYTVITQYSE